MRGLIIGLSAAALVTLGPSAVSAEDGLAAASIDRYLIEADINEDGSIAVTESVTFTQGSAVPDGFADQLAMWRIPDQPERISKRDIRVERFDSDPVQFNATYTISGAFVTFTQADLSADNPLDLAPGDAEIFAEIIGPFPDTSIREARIEVRTPGPALAAACFVNGRSIPVCTDRIGADTTTFRSLDLTPGVSMTIAMVIDGSTMSLPVEPETVRANSGFPWMLALIVTAAIALTAIAVVALSRRRQ